MTDKKIFLVLTKYDRFVEENFNRPDEEEKCVELTPELEEKITQEFVEWWVKQEQTSLRQEAKFIFLKLRSSV